MEFLQRSLTARVLTLFLLLTIVPIAVIGYIAYRSGRQSIVDNVESHLESVAILKEQEIHNWLEHLEHAITWLAVNPNTINNAYIMATHTIDDPEYLKAHDLLVSAFKRITTIGHLSPVYLLDSASGKVITSSDTSWEGKFRESEPYFIQGKTKTYISDIFYSLTLGQPTMVISTPVEDSNGKLLGVMVAHANLESLNEVMLERSGLGETGETFLVNSSNLLITNTVFAPDGAFKKWIFGQGTEWALDGKTGVGLFTDYREVPVIGAYRWLGDLRLALIAKKDRSEAFAPIVTLEYTVLGIGVLVVLVVALLSVIFAHTITRPIHRLTEGAEIVGAGNLDYKVGTVAKDEIGKLSRAFDEMTKSLKEITVSRNELAKENAERKRAEEKLRESEEKLDNFMNSSVDGFVLLDSKLNYVKVNKALLDIVGLKKEDFIGKNITDVVPDIKEVGRYDKYMEVIKKGKPLFIDEMIPHPRFGDIYLALRVFKVGDGLGITVRDITERKHAEDKLKEYSERLEEMVEELKDAQEELIRKEKLAILGQLSGGVGHELRNPLGVINNAIYYLKTILPDADETTKEYLEIISSEVQNSEKIVSDLLDFSRTKTSEREETVVSDLVDMVLTKLTQPDDVKVVTDIATDIPQIYVDPRQMGQVLDNLVTNAYQAMPEGGELKIEAKKIKSKVHVLFKDTGSGISKENMKKLFEPLFTTKARGIGLGLSVSKNLIGVNGGRIEVESEEGKGSIFTIILPTKGGKS